jgi:hypothetical protein
VETHPLCTPTPAHPVHTLGHATCTITYRTPQLSQKKSALQFKTLDSTLRTQAPDGTDTVATHRCHDIDKLVPTLLGVSKVGGGCCVRVVVG